MNKEGVLKGVFWRFAERCGAQGISFVVSLVLARILSPSEFGTISLVLIFTSILQAFIDGGLGNSLIQKKDTDELDFSSVFIFNVVMCIVIYILLFVSAPFIVSFFQLGDLTSIIRFLGIILIISGLRNIQQAYVYRNLLFKRFFYSTLGGTIVSAIIGIIMAMNGFGVWSLAVQQVLNLAIDTIILWFTVKWKPSMKFSMKRFRGLAGFGFNLLISALLETIYNNISSLIIGKMYSTDDLAFFNKGKQFPNLVIVNVNTSIESVLLPTMSSVQDDIPRLKEMTRQSIKTSCYIIWPIMMLLVVCAKPLVSIILTEKWLPCVPYLQLFCINYAFWPLHTANLNAIKAVGRSDIFLKVEIIKKVIGIVALILSLRYGVFVIAFTLMLTSPISAVINAFPNRKLLNYSLKEQIVDIIPSLLLTIFMGILMASITLINMNIILLLVVQLLLSITIYISLSVIFKIDVFYSIKKMLKKILEK